MLRRREKKGRTIFFFCGRRALLLTCLGWAFIKMASTGEAS